MKKVVYMIVAMAMMLVAVACADDADVASRNISKAADNFEVERRIVFYNGITDEIIMVTEGQCSIFEDQGVVRAQLEVTCKTGPDEYMKHFLGLSDNVTYFVEQKVASDASVYYYRRTFKPQSVIPDIDTRLTNKAPGKDRDQ